MVFRWLRWRWRRWLRLSGLFLLPLWLSVWTAYAASNVLPDAGRLTDQVLPADPNQFKPPECAGITIQNIVVSNGAWVMTNGTGGNDLMLGTNQVDILYGQGGRDCILGGGGDDGLVLFPWAWVFLDGGQGNDVVLGGPGHDVLAGEVGNDMLYGEAGNDFLFGDAGRDWLNGGPGVDYCDGGAGADTLLNCETAINALVRPPAGAAVPLAAPLAAPVEGVERRWIETQAK